MNGVVKINKCSVNKVMRVVHDTKNAYSVCLFTANYTKQAEAFPDNIQKYGTTALFKVSSYHLPAKLLGKISFNLEGHWEKDTHGTKGDEKIFVAEKASESMPETRAEIIKFLMNSSKGVGKVTAETIYNKFGDETLDICAHKPRRLRDIPKMTEQMLGNINAACLSALVRADVQILLGKAELEVSVINQIVEAYGDEATTVLKSEPYKLVRLLGFSTTDHIAMSMGEEPDSERRLRAATIEAQKRTCSKTGNMCAEGSAMLLQLKALVPELSDETIADAVAKTAADYDIVRQGRYYYDKTDFIAERGMAAKVAALANEMPTKEKEIENAFLEWQKENSIILSPRQAEAVKNLKYRISIVTGGPGTGKTTCLRAIMDVYHKVWPSEHKLMRWIVSYEHRRADVITKILKDSNASKQNADFNYVCSLMYKSVIIGKTCAMIPKIITGNKYGKAVTNPGKNGIADNLLTLANLEQVYARNYFVPTNTLGVELLSRTVTLTRDDLNQMIEMWLSEMTNTHTCVDAREYTEAYIDDDSEKTLIFPIIELEELVYQKAGREKYHIVCERGTQDGISRTMGNKVIDFKDMNNEPMPAHKYDDAGIRRDGINPLTHSGYWEEEP